MAILPFQFLIMPVQWASEAAANIADPVAVEFECQVHYEDSRRTVACYPASLLTAMEQGNSLYVLCPPLETEAANSKEDSYGSL